jgi:holo-[acyl-carrier protein] synthase
MIVSTGVDIVEVSRIKEMTEKHADRFLKRIFTAREITYCRARKYKYEHFAARFAAKEAAMKALGVGLGSVALREIEVVRMPRGDVRLQLVGKALEKADGLGIAQFHLSLSHTRDYAVAVVIGEKEERKKF